MSERGPIGKDFPINIEGVNPLALNKENPLARQVSEFAKGGAGGKKQNEGESEKKTTARTKKKETEPTKKTSQEIIKTLSETDPIIKKVFEKSPPNTATIETFLASQLEKGKTLKQAGIALKEVVENGKQFDQLAALDATKVLTSIATETDSPELCVPYGAVSKKIKLYDEPSLSLKLEEVQEPVKGTLSDDEYQVQLENYKKYALKQRQHQNLVKDLQQFDEEVARLGLVDAVEAKKRLREFGRSILEGEHSTEMFRTEGNKRMSYTKAPKYNVEETQKITERIRIQREQIEAELIAKNERIKLERKNEQKNRKTNIFDINRDRNVQNKPIVESNWVYLKDQNGQIIHPEDHVVDAANPTRILDKTALVNWLQEAERMGLNPREDQLNELYERLQQLPEASKSVVIDNNSGDVVEEYYNITQEDIRPYAEKVKTTFLRMTGERPQLTPEYLEQIQTVKGRDAIFYDIIRPLLDNPTETSRELLNLFQQQKLDTFMYALGTSVDFPTGGVIRHEDLRAQLVARYSNLKEAIVSYHDLDYQARNAGGDIKSFKGAVTYFHNAYFIEAINDPISQTLARCYEQALKIIKDNNNGYIPPEMVSYDPKTRINQWDEMALDLFRNHVKAGNIKDIQYDQTGAPILDKSGKRYKLGDTFTEQDMDEQYLRIKAAMQMGKGVGILNMRLLEIFARSKTPGYGNAEFGKPGPLFSSKAYEGIARWFNPMADFFGKFKMGDQMHQAFFGALMGLEKGDIESLVKLNINQWKEITRASQEGTLEKWIEKRYGKEKVNRLLDAVDLMFFSGRCGPLSGWGEADITIGMSDRDKERLGGSMRLFKAEEWAKRKVEKAFKEKRIRENVHDFDHLSENEQKRVREEQNPSLDTEWLSTMQSEHKRHPYDYQIEQYTKAYRTYIWTQYAERFPTAFAGSVLDKEATYRVGNETLHKSIRSVVMEEILSTDSKTQEFLRDQYGANNENAAFPEDRTDLLKLDMQRDVVSDKTPDFSRKKLMARVEAIEQDVMVVEQQALFGGDNDNMPREIRDSDFECIKGSKKIIVNGIDCGEIDEATRRSQAKTYVEGIRKKILGDKTGEEWRRLIGGINENGEVKWIDKNKNVVLNVENIDAVLAGSNSLLDENLITRKDAVHMGTEDVQWSYLDMETLGERQWARRANDLENRSNTILAMVDYLQLLRVHPDVKELAKQLGVIYKSEQGHDPKEAHKFVYMWALATGEIYRQGKVAYIPFLGKLIQKIVPLSVAQQIKGAGEADAWSTNNAHQFLHEVEQQTGLPTKNINLQGELTPYNLEKLEKNLGATKLTAALEMIFLGYSIAAVATMLSAASKSVDEEKKH